MGAREEYLSIHSFLVRWIRPLVVGRKKEGKEEVVFQSRGRGCGRGLFLAILRPS